MGVKERQARHRDELREKILDAARELLVRDGVEQVSMRKIAKKINYTATTLFHHFPNKDALLWAVCEADFLALRRSFEKIATIADPLERLRSMGAAYVSFALEHPSHYRLMFMTPQLHQGNFESEKLHKGNPDQDAYAFLRATVAAVIEAGLLCDEHKDADLVAQIMWSGVHGVVALHLIMGNDTWLEWRPVETIASGVVETMIAGMIRPGKRA
ncbi:MAG: TetR/AcrR family transcriptional regulator [Isosphaeraceae bacterium]